MIRFASLAALCLALSLPGPLRAQSAAPRKVALHGPEVAIPFAIEGSRPIPVIEAMVAGRGPFRFYFDTGASGCVLDSALARELELEILGQVQVGDSTPTGTLEADQVVIPHLAIGDAEWLDLPSVAFDRSRFGAAEGVVGVLGLPLAAEHLLTVDYSAGRIRISDEALPETGEGIVPLHGGSELPLVEIVVAGKPIRSHIDTGSPSGFTLPAAFAADLKWKQEPVVVGRGGTVASQFDIRRGQLDGAIVLGGRSFADPEVHVNDRFPTANVGRQVLSEFVFSIDQRNLRARFLPAQRAVVIPSADPPGGGGSRPNR